MGSKPNLGLEVIKIGNNNFEHCLGMALVVDGGLHGALVLNTHFWYGFQRDSNDTAPMEILDVDIQTGGEKSTRKTKKTTVSFQ